MIRRSSDPSAGPVFWGGYNRAAPSFFYDHRSADCPNCGRVCFFRQAKSTEPWRCRGCGYQLRTPYEQPAVIASEHSEPAQGMPPP
jgi:ribosomal protein S27E